MINTIFLLLIETLSFIIFIAFLYNIISDILVYFKIAYYVSDRIIDIIILVINYLIAVIGIILALIISPQYAMFGYYYAALTTITLILFAL